MLRDRSGEGSTERVRSGMVHADRDDRPEEGRWATQVDKLVLPGPTGEVDGVQAGDIVGPGGAPACRGGGPRSIGDRSARRPGRVFPGVVVLPRWDDGVDQHFYRPPEPSPVALEPAAFLER